MCKQLPDQFYQLTVWFIFSELIHSEHEEVTAQSDKVEEQK
jgi:hypothetical protein